MGSSSKGVGVGRGVLLGCALAGIFLADSAYGQRGRTRPPQARTQAAAQPKANPEPISLWRDSKKGDIGALGGLIEGRRVVSTWSFTVTRIIDDATAEVRCEVVVAMTKEEEKAYGTFYGEKKVKWTFLLKSPAAVKNLHEEQNLVRIPGRFVHQGRQRYDFGMVDVVADAPPEKPMPAAGLPKEDGAPGPAPKVAAPAAEYRSWTDNTGEHTVEARFKGMGFGQVRLVKRDGQEITLPLEKLSAADQEWVKRRPHK
jgi:hypothetical protein